MSWHVPFLNKCWDTCLHTLDLSLHSLPSLPPLLGLGIFFFCLCLFSSFSFCFILRNFSSGFSMTYLPFVCP